MRMMAQRNVMRMIALSSILVIGCSGATSEAPGADAGVDANPGTDAGCVPAVETCNGLDDDCNGVVDEDLAGPPCAFSQGVCVGASAVCGGAAGWLECGAAEYGSDYEPGEVSCEGLDNDCDGSTDEGCVCTNGDTQSCGSDVGACERGIQTCAGAAWGTCAGEVGPMGETCDGLDNDCDEMVDEPSELSAPDCPMQLGVCTGAKRSCDGGAGWGACAGVPSYGPDYEASEVSCDGLDNDCDGVIDEGCDCIDGSTQSCGSNLGACQSGLQTCAGGGWGACAGGVVPTDETCNGLDDDCDGMTDEDLVAPACALGEGVCSGATASCGGVAGWAACSGTDSYGPRYEPDETTCDGFDNDCDGAIDETCTCVVGATQPCGSAVGACESGFQACDPDGWGTCVGSVDPSVEVCNGIDDDCDGESDEDLIAPSCELQEGVCAGTSGVCNGTSGWFECSGTDSYGASYESIETSCEDGLDNDCNGGVDNGELCSATNPPGGHLQSWRIGGTDWDFGSAVALFGATLLVAGDFSDVVDFGSGSLASAGAGDAFTAVFSDNTLMGVDTAGGTGSDSVSAVAVTSTGNVVVAGEFADTIDLGGGVLTSAGQSDIFLAMYSPTGEHLWSRRFGGAQRDYVAGVGVDSAGDVIFAGGFQGTVDFGGSSPLVSAGGFDTVVAKYAANAGAHVWSRRLGGASGDGAQGLAVDALGNAIVVGWFEGTANFGGSSFTSAGLDDVFVAKYAAVDGNHWWSQRYGGTEGDVVQDVVTDSSGDVFVTGLFNGNASFGGTVLQSAGQSDIFVAKYAVTTGAHLWSKRFGSTAADRGQGLAVIGDDIVVTGSFRDTVSFGGASLTSAGGSKDMFVARFVGNDGAHVWSVRGGGMSSDFGTAITASSAAIVVVGNFFGTIDLGGGPLVSAGLRDIFVLRLVP